MSNQQPEYLSYLLRMWRVQEDGGATWRASLERPGNHDRHTFTSLEAAFDFLRQRAGEAESPGRPERPAAGLP
jgi:hypothetical protein